MSNIQTIVEKALSPELGYGPVKVSVSEEKTTVQVSLVFEYPAKTVFADTKQKVAEVIKTQLGRTADVKCSAQIHPRITQGGTRRLPQVKNIIAVSSAKGGVGKSATAVNLALALEQEGARTGVLDADIYGPSLPVMLGVRRRPQAREGKIEPLNARGLQLMSAGFLVDEDQPAIWRGPMATRALMQLLQETAWDALDFLVLDMPPGTGDIQLTASQKMPLTGAIVVTTPQDIAVSDAQKGLVMFNKVGVPVLGLVENMSGYACPCCGHKVAIFGDGGAQRLCEKYEVPLLGQIPLQESIRQDADAGTPTVCKSPDSETAEIYRQIARRAAAQVAQKPKDHSGSIPQVVAEK